MNIEHVLQRKAGSGHSDIHLLHRHCIIEVKRSERLKNGPFDPKSGSSRKGKKDESAFEQLERYIKLERSKHHVINTRKKLQWRGFVTDGIIWWGWDWPLFGEGENAVELGDWQKTILAHNNVNEFLALIDRGGKGKPWAPEKISTFFQTSYDLLSEIYHKRKIYSETKTQKRLWLEQLRGSGNNPDQKDEDSLFVTHTFLILISRMISGLKPTNKIDKERLIDGFVGWTKESNRLLNNIYQIIDRYDWGPNQGDIMRSLYNDFVDEEHRRDYGEFYTPDWLAEKLCQELIDEEYVNSQLIEFVNKKPVHGILDPTCGSGTFLYHAAKHIAQSKCMQEQYLNNSEKVDFICSMINGIEIHPVAIELSIANMTRLFGNVNIDNLHIFQGDSLVINRAKAPVLDDDNVLIIKSENKELIQMPYDFLKSRSNINKFVKSATDDKDLPVAVSAMMDEHQKNVLIDAHNKMRVLIKRDGNGVWAWYIRNQTAPLLLKRDNRPARIIANPPWVNNNDINDKEREKSLKELAKRQELFVGGHESSNFDIACLFLKFCMQEYLPRDAKACWVLPQRSMFGAAEWEKARKHFIGRLGIWDLGKLPFKTPAASAAAFFINMKINARKKLVLNDGESMPESDETWAMVESKTHLEKFHKLFSSEKSSWFGKKKIQTKSGDIRYSHIKHAMAHNGAHLTANVLILINPNSLDKTKTRTSFYTIKSEKKKWGQVDPLRGNVPNGWIKKCIGGDDLIAYYSPTKTRYVLPIDSDGDWLPNRYDEDFWKTASETYVGYRSKSTPNNIDLDINSGDKLKKQFSTMQNRVIYTASGYRLYAARESHSIINGSFWRINCKKEDEALFLVGILNSNCIQLALEQAKTSHLNYHRTFWSKVPIPRYDSNNKIHKKIAVLASKAEIMVKDNYEQGTSKLKAREKSIKILVESGLMKKIDDAVREILPNHTTVD